MLVIDDNAEVRETVAAILGDEGYDVHLLEHGPDEAMRAAIDRIEPHCILLDGAGTTGYPTAWATAAAVRHRQRPIPTVMFTAHRPEAAEADLATSDRSMTAGFAAVLRKPFALEDLISTVERAVGAGGSTL